MLARLHRSAIMKLNTKSFGYGYQHTGYVLGPKPGQSRGRVVDPHEKPAYWAGLSASMQQYLWRRHNNVGGDQRDRTTNRIVSARKQPPIHIHTRLSANGNGRHDGSFKNGIGIESR